MLEQKIDNLADTIERLIVVMSNQAGAAKAEPPKEKQVIYAHVPPKETTEEKAPVPEPVEQASEEVTLDELRKLAMTMAKSNSKEFVSKAMHKACADAEKLSDLDEAQRVVMYQELQVAP